MHRLLWLLFIQLTRPVEYVSILRKRSSSSLSCPKQQHTSNKLHAFSTFMFACPGQTIQWLCFYFSIILKKPWAGRSPDCCSVWASPVFLIQERPSQWTGRTLSEKWIKFLMLLSNETIFVRCQHTTLTQRVKVRTLQSLLTLPDLNCGEVQPLVVADVNYPWHHTPDSSHSR